MAVTRTREPSSHAAAGLSVPAIVEQALAIIGEHGVAGLTMNALAKRLGVRTPSLYHHVRDKAALLDLVAANAFAGFAAYDSEAYADVASVDEWIELVAAGSLRLRKFYASHPGLAALIQSTATRNRDHGHGSRAVLVGAQIQALTRLGVAEADARDVFETCARWTMAAVAAEDHTPDGPDDAMFHRGLNWLLAGLRADITHAISPDE